MGATNKRLRCPSCDFILVRCLCDTLKPIDNFIELVILQHPSETLHALNTVALMKKSFQRITVLIGEDFTDNHLLNSLLLNPNNSIALLYPTQNSTLLNSAENLPLTHLILIDGTWKKAHKIVTTSKNLHPLHSIKLESTDGGFYRIRASQKKESLSTLEASIAALKILEEKLETKSLEDSFNKMIEFQIEKMGTETFKKNYLSKKENDE